MSYDLIEDAPFVSISEAATALDASIDTIRRWEKKGLIKAHRSDTGHRLFQITELQRLKAKLFGAGDDHCYKILTAPSRTQFKVVELFAGAGGLALGFHNAGLDCSMLVEIDKNPVETLRHNCPSWNVIHDDIANVDFQGITADVVAGGFPCQAFSYAGKKLGFEDTRGTLFFEYARAIKEINPKVIVGENVRGLEKHDSGRTLNTMLQILDQLGYDVEYKILRAQYLDVPQKRERLVMLGIRKDLKGTIAFPKEQDYTISLREALKDVPDAPGQKYTEKKSKVMSLVPEGGYWRDLPDDKQKEYMGASYFLGGGKTGMARRLAWDEPSLTLTCNPAQKQTERCHPKETRPLNVREYARIQTFPDSWMFSGTVSSQYKQIGNAVPVNLGYHIGRCVIAMLTQRFDRKDLIICSRKPD
ncbi:TPA: DNA (cytosine-5-)-methyltransferase [Legionella pneumophila]|uniref:Cytosine-specific methyltransferase n=1 Tax=Legionella pneumophila subsp. pneumophila (strain Philadelphia 1 / ATCC 33152 / DSM 7513) TaxID=272624 RepID=Q5ZW51_LEGPH|nr:DNA (cytosine-5-)-methyltransferase [Legionella pneumophila]AAU27320.1 modification methylase (Eco47II, Sau96I) [Legionella pneumophila subsp. pneumophila str. Philadelphia 1]AGN14132.1 DNA (cytosine-5-)-methyltransferase [Legionella pneumophila subsp. pneumophila str. Thunder Bay]AOU10263.1 DNA (cytosine-5-)-methyltransferase [Legionella pneumophila]AOU13181.1 DNA (cytosine-5-)-methyltransferase [Legionella pneumophila]AOU16187.1 DNA (cytosine-5-)-methyltransferase [Legionella pneumophila]